jgi:AcrR family transcriptional regulator
MHEAGAGMAPADLRYNFQPDFADVPMPKRTPPAKKRTRNPAITRTKLLRATMELVSQKGAAALSLKEAARVANVSRGVAYLHFEDRDQLLQEAKTWISERLQEGVRKFDSSASLHDRTVHTSKLVLDHPEASQLMITDVMEGKNLSRGHSLYKFVLTMLKDLKASGMARPDLDVEVATYIMFGSIAATVMFGAQRKGEDADALAERFAKEWNRILQTGLFLRSAKLEKTGKQGRPTPAKAKKPPARR